MTTDNLENFIRENRAEFDDAEPAAELWGRIAQKLGEHNDGRDPLESFVLSNRDEFDNVTPPPRLEGRIFAAVEGKVSPAVSSPKSRLRVVRILSLAASFLLVLSIGYWMGTSQQSMASQDELVAMELEKIDPELVEAETYYRSEIKAQFTKVTQVNQDPQLRADLEEIDKHTAEIRTALLEVPISQRAELVNQLIETYRTKLDILLRIQQHLPSGDASPTQQQTTDEI
jgi:flagellar basal body-associated protein FliL